MHEPGGEENEQNGRHRPEKIPERRSIDESFTRNEKNFLIKILPHHNVIVAQLFALEERNTTTDECLDDLVEYE